MMAFLWAVSTQRKVDIYSVPCGLPTGMELIVPDPHCFSDTLINPANRY